MDGGASSSRRLLLTVAVAFVTGSALKDFFSAFTNGLVIPILTAALPGLQQTVGGAEVIIGGVKVEVGKVMSATATLMLTLLVVSFTLPYIKTYAPISGAKRA